MTIRRTLLLGALASCFLLAGGVDTRAAYTYTTGSVTQTPAAPAALGETITPTPPATVSLDLPTGPSFVTISYAPTSTVTGFTQTLSWTETLTSTTTGTTGTFSISGILNVLSASSVGVSAIFTGVTINGTPVTPGVGSASSGGFNLSLIGYAPRIGTDGRIADIGFNIIPPVPEPASLAMMGTGLVGVLGIGLRRSRTKAKV